MHASGWKLAGQEAVPHTGARGHFARWLRRPRHIGFERAALADFDSLRGLTLPPDAWDDVPRSRRRDRSWKQHRRYQFRSTPVGSGAWSKRKHMAFFLRIGGWSA